MDRRELQKIADSVRAKIDTYCQTEYDDGFRSHLGASLIGHKCKRYLWFSFRWVYHHVHTGRMQRLFNRGHLEENRIEEWLKGSGYEVERFDSNGNQFRVSGCNGHFGGSGDGFIVLPDLGKCLLECKTSKDGAEFKSLFENGVEVMKPRHFTQMCVYGAKFGISFALYICVNKNNDELYIEVIELRPSVANEAEEKASEVIFSQTMPERQSETPTFWECKLCDMVEVCFKNKKAEKNCRSCKNARPIDNGEWSCDIYGVIPKQYIPQGCDNWKSILE